MTPRAAAVLALAVLGVALVATLALTTPWQPLPGPVPGGRTAPAPAQDFTATERAREQNFHRELRPAAYAGIVVGLLTAAALGLSPLGARLVGRLPGPWLVRTVLAALVVTLVPAVVALPLGARREVVLRRYGLSTRDWTGWWADQGRGWAVTAVIAAVMLVVLVGIARAAPRWWWAWTAVASAALVVTLSFLYPLVIEPVFNKFTPLPDGPLRTAVLDLARRDGVPVRDVLVADASRRTSALNAYVSGIGATRRVVLYDTLVAKASQAEVELVVAHELGHVKANDVRDGTLIGALGAALAMVLLYLVLGWEPLARRTGADGLGDPRIAAFVVLAVALLAQLSAPVQLLVSRRIEARADLHSLDLTRDPETFVRSERTLAVTNLSDLDPHPLVYALFFSHPSTPERIALARDWAKVHGVPVPPRQVPE